MKIRMRKATTSLYSVPKLPFVRMGSIPGAILGAAALTILNLDVLKTFSEFVRTSLPQIPNQVDPAKYERLVFGLILVLMMIFRPEGLIPEKRHKAEMEEA